jgi:hypothetical protein
VPLIRSRSWIHFDKIGISLDARLRITSTRILRWSKFNRRCRLVLATHLIHCRVARSLVKTRGWSEFAMTLLAERDAKPSYLIASKRRLHGKPHKQMKCMHHARVKEVYYTSLFFFFLSLLSLKKKLFIYNLILYIHSYLVLFCTVQKSCDCLKSMSCTSS